MPMRPVTAALLAHCLLPQMSILAAGLVVETARKPFSTEECFNVVKKVQVTGRYTEESIALVCNEEMKAANCEFFAEALSLASSHGDFRSETFCSNMDRAQFCSQIMDKLLQSRAVSDLAFGRCERAKPQKSIDYCRRIQKMLALSVKQEDLDTMRACYTLEAYSNQTSEAAPKMRIITEGNKELDSAGKGQGEGPPQIVARPSPLDTFGEGKGNITSSQTKTNVTNPQTENIITKPILADKPAAAPQSKAIITEPIAAVNPANATPKEPAPPKPIPVGESSSLEAFGRGNGSFTTPSPKGIITEPIPAGPTTSPEPRERKSIVAKPIPADEQAKAIPADKPPGTAFQRQQATVPAPVEQSQLQRRKLRERLVAEPPPQLLLSPPRAAAQPLIKVLGVQPTTPLARSPQSSEALPTATALHSVAKTKVIAEPNVKQAPVMEHSAWLLQDHLRRGKVLPTVQEDNNKNTEYSGFLSAFVS